MKKKYRHILAFGSNLGDKKKNCDLGLIKLKEHCEILRISKSLNTKAFTLKDEQQPDYLNFIVEVASAYDSYDLYQKIIKIEDFVGHNRSVKWAARHLDIDVLFSAFNCADSFCDCKNIFLQKKDFAVPHYGISQRKFLLELLEKDFGLDLLKLVA
jgi:2-amino-4-hydroxy-6-hydroxymethyldihydropteridine diphosphokinase